MFFVLNRFVKGSVSKVPELRGEIVFDFRVFLLRSMLPQAVNHGKFSVLFNPYGIKWRRILLVEMWLFNTRDITLFLETTRATLPL